MKAGWGCLRSGENSRHPGTTFLCSCDIPVRHQIWEVPVCELPAFHLAVGPLIGSRARLQSPSVHPSLLPGVFWHPLSALQGSCGSQGWDLKVREVVSSQIVGGFLMRWGRPASTPALSWGPRPCLPLPHFKARLSGTGSACRSPIVPAAAGVAKITCLLSRLQIKLTPAFC